MGLYIYIYISLNKPYADVFSCAYGKKHIKKNKQKKVGGLVAE